jgi:PAS domain S-box-containing protein
MPEKNNQIIETEMLALDETAGDFIGNETAQYWLAALIDSADDAVISKTLDGIIKSWNKAAERIFGYSAGEVIGKSVLILIPPERKHEETLILEKIKRGERIEHYETIRVGKDGSHIEISLTVSPINDAGGTVIGVSKIARDISQRKRIEKQLSESDERYRTLFDSIDQGFCLCEVLFDESGRAIDYRFLEINPAFEKMTGIPNDEAVGDKTVLQLIPNLERKWIELYGKIALTGDPIRFIEHSEAMNRWFDVFGFRVGSENSRKVALLFNDITKSRQTEDSLRESREMLSLAMASSRMGAWSRDFTSDAVYWSAELEAIFGLPAGTFSGTLGGFRDYVYAEDKDQIGKEVERAIREKTDYIIEFRFHHADGTLRWMEGRGQAVYSAEGTPLKSYGIGIDITERKLEELDRQFLLELGEKIRYGGINRENTLAEVTEMTSRYLDTARCMFIEINESENRGVIRQEHCRRNVASVTGEYKISDYSPQTLDEIKSGRIIVNNDVERDPRTADIFQKTYESYDERSYVSVPLFTNERWSAIFWVSDDKPRRWTEREIALLAAVGERAWLAAEKIRNEKALEQSRERLQMAMDAAKIYSWELNPFNYKAEWSNNFEQVIGFSISPHSEINFYDLVHPEDRELLGVKVLGAINNRQPYESEFRLVNPTTGEIVWVRAQGVLVDDFAGEQRLVGITQNINERKQVEQEREKLLEREREARRLAEESSRLKDEFLATVSHELRTPLNAILGWSQMLDTGKFTAVDTARAVKTIYRNAKSQAKLIEDILDVSRIITGKLRIEIKPTTLAPIIQSAVETLRPTIEAKNIKLQMRLDFETKPILADPDRMLQVFWNIISNAVKFTPENGQVNVELINQARQIKIIVSDTGKGIEPEFLPFVFDRFRQADGTSTRSHGGLGLGLSIVRHVVELHGGTVEVASQGVGSGTIFTVFLPVYSGENDGEKSIENNATKEVISYQELGGVYSPPDSQNPLEGVRVLLIDDEKDALEMLAAMLSQAGAEVNQQTNVTDALEIVKEWIPQVIVSDIGMPEIDGYAFIEKLRALPREKGGEIPVVALTAYAGLSEQKRVLSNGFQMYLTKPVGSTELIAALKNLTEDSKL